MDAWLTTYTAISLECNISILDSLFRNFPATTALGIWKQLEAEAEWSEDYTLLKFTLESILLKNKWKSLTYKGYCPLGPTGNLVNITLEGPFEFREQYGQLAISIDRFAYPPKWNTILRGDDGLYIVNVAFGQFEDSFAKEMRIFSEEFQKCLQLIQPKDQVDVENFISLLRRVIIDRRPLLHEMDSGEGFLNEALRAYTRESLKK